MGIEQIEAMLAEKTRQKVKGSESENNTWVRQCKHFDIANKNFLNFEQFVQTLESFGAMAPAKDLATLFGKWCVEEKSIKKLKYREFVNEFQKILIYNFVFSFYLIVVSFTAAFESHS